MSTMKTTILLAVVAVLGVLAVPARGDGGGPCTPVLGGAQFNLTALARNASLPAYTFDSDEFTYYFDVCAAAQSPCGNDYVAYQQQRASPQGCWGLGIANVSHWDLITPTDPDQGVQVTYEEGEMCSSMALRSVTIQFPCDKSAKPGKPVSVDEPENCVYVVVFPSVYGCPVS